jgi:hypothetical protein
VIIVLEWSVEILYIGVECGIVCFGMECGYCVCWNGVEIVSVFEWSEEIECVGMECENCVSWNGVWELCVCVGLQCGNCVGIV